MSSWQDLLVWGVVAGAAGVLLRRVWRLIRGQQPTGCGACGKGCSDAPPLLRIELPGGRLDGGRASPKIEPRPTNHTDY